MATYGIAENKQLMPLEAGGGAEIAIGTYTGDGATSRTIQLDFTPRLVTVWCSGKPPCTQAAGAPVLIYTATATAEGATKGTYTIGGPSFKVLSPTSNPPDGLKAQLNLKDAKYLYMAIK